MSIYYNYLIVFIGLVLSMLVYFKLANKYQILDIPNNRSSHSLVTVRGGGIIFPIACLFQFIFFGFEDPWFLIGLLIISLISFLDDILTLDSKIRMLFQFTAVLMLGFALQLFKIIPAYGILIVFVLIVATINAYNFMDGINGLTGSYSLLTVISLYYINTYVVSFADPSLLIVTAMALLIFNFFNFRTRAKCFAGDVGSVSIAFILVFLIGRLMLATSNLSYILLLLVYGLDTATTIVFRLIRKENIMQPHRSHYYQFLANEKKWGHLKVSSLYFLLQLTINCLLIFFLNDNLGLAILATVLISVLFIGLRFWQEGGKRLLKPLS